MSQSVNQAVDPTPGAVAEVRQRFGDRFIAARVEAEQQARKLLDRRAGALTLEDALELGQLFNRHEAGGRVRQDRFTPGFTGAVWAKVTENLDRFNELVTRLWTAPPDEALETLGRMFGDRSMLPGAGRSLPSMLLYLRDPQQFGICIDATTKGLSHAVGDSLRADDRAGYLRFCGVLQDWRTRYGIAPQEADAVLTALMRTIPQDDSSAASELVFGDGPSRFLADLAANNTGAWMQANRQRYQDDLRRPFVRLLEQVAARHLRELDPLLRTAVKTTGVLASIRKRFPDREGEYYPYLWGAFCRGRKQEDVQLAVLVQPAGLDVSLFLGSASPPQITRLTEALAHHGDTLFTPLAAFDGKLRWETEDRTNPLAAADSGEVSDAQAAHDWLARGGTSIKWFLTRGAQRCRTPGWSTALVTSSGQSTHGRRPPGPTPTRRPRPANRPTWLKTSAMSMGD